MLKTLTKREKEILDYIKISTSIHGFAPSLIEIKNHFNLKAVSTIHEHIQNLKRKGYITKEISQARSLKIVNTELSDQDFIEIPIFFEIDNNLKLKDHLAKNSVYIHKTSLDGEGKYIGIMNKSNKYINSGIIEKDIIIIKEMNKLPFNNKAICIVNNSILIGEIIEENQLPAFKDSIDNKIYNSNFEIKGKLICLIRSF